MKVEDSNQQRGSSDNCDFVEVEFTNKRNRDVFILRFNMIVTSIILAVITVGIVCKLLF